MIKILLTGATGLVGGAVLQNLVESGYHVTLLVRSTFQESATERVAKRLLSRGVHLETYGSSLAVVDTPSRAVLWESAGIPSSYDVVVHCAANTSFWPSSGQYEDNIDMTARLLSWLSASDVKIKPSVIVIGTAAVSAIKNGKDVKEETKGRLWNEYLRSKYDVEQLVSGYKHNAVVLRPSVVLPSGEGDPKYSHEMLWPVIAIENMSVCPLDDSWVLDCITSDYLAYVVEKYVDSCIRRKFIEWSSINVTAASHNAAIIGDLRKLSSSRRLKSMVAMPTWGISGSPETSAMKYLRLVLPYLQENVSYSNSKLLKECDQCNRSVVYEVFTNALRQLSSRKVASGWCQNATFRVHRE